MAPNTSSSDGTAVEKAVDQESLMVNTLPSTEPPPLTNPLPTKGLEEEKANPAPVVTGTSKDEQYLVQEVEPAPLRKNRKLPRGWGDKHVSPEARAGIFSKLTYWWMNDVFWVGWNRPLDTEDIWKLSPHWQVQHMHARFDASWEEEKLRAAGKAPPAGKGKGFKVPFTSYKYPAVDKATGKPPQPGLFRAIYRAWFWQIAPVGIVKFTADMSNVFSPLLVKYILQFVARSQFVNNGNDVTGSNNSLPPLAEGFGYVIALFILQVLQSVLNSLFFQTCTTQGMAIRSSLTAAIYRKTIRLSASARQNFNAGKVMNMVATDTQRVELFIQFIHIIWAAPVQITAIAIFLIVQLGWCALAGMGLLVLCGPLQSRVMAVLRDIRKSVAPITDSRVKLTQEILSGIRVIKFFAWEKPFLKKVEGIRDKEIHQVLRRGKLQAFVLAVAFGIPIMSAALAIVLYAVTNPLDATKIFPALTWFIQLRFPLMFLPQLIVGLADFRVALNRITELLMAPELDAQPERVDGVDYALKVDQGEFEWEQPLGAPVDAKGKQKEGGGSEKTGADKAPAKGKSESANPMLSEPSDADVPSATSSVDQGISTLRNISFTVPKGALVAIVGPVGSGKSSLLNALIGEMKRKSGTVSFSGSLGYCPQQAWIQNASLRENITFGQPFDAQRYLRALRDCALEQDLALLSDGDMTQIGERGINLSGGQKQRVNLARMVYYDSDIVLLDDPLSAVDAHVGKYLFERCIAGTLKNKTRILVTHQLHVVPDVDYVICMKNGEIAEMGTYQELMAVESGEFASLMKRYGGIEEGIGAGDGVETISVGAQALLDENDEAAMQRLGKSIVQNKAARQLMTTEEKASGSVDWTVWLAYARAAGGQIFVLYLLLLMVFVQISRVGTDLWLVYWTNNQITSFSNNQYVAVYWGWGVFQTIMIYCFGLFFAYAGTRAARVLHDHALSRVLESPVRFFDSTPLGRIINRFSKDQDTIDNTLADSFRMFINTFASTISTFILIIYATPIFLAPLLVVLVFYWFFQKLYRGASRELKRLDSTTRSPLYASFGETLVGAATIRAYGEQNRFIDVNDARINGNNAPYFLLITAQRWLAIRLESLGALLVFFAGLFGLLARTSLSAALLGLSLSYALQVTQTLNWCVRQFTETEIAMNAVERVNHYAYQIEREPLPANPPPPSSLSASKADGSAQPVASEVTVFVDVPREPTKPPPHGWPTTGAISIRNLTLQYAPDLPAVLHDLTLSVNHMEKIGVCGRTGSGKSTLIQSLYRTVEPCLGSVISIDGLDTQTLPLYDLRRAIAIIPQDPTLFSGTFRSNLDPFSEYTDEDLLVALRRARLGDDVVAKGGLEGPVAEGGENLSVGQRQLVCLARAMVRKPKILIMDEATANVDLETDAVVQKVLREEFAECTVLCVAHRLNTIIDYDRVLVLKDGRIAEYDTPRNLLSKPDSDPNAVFKSMIEETGATNAEMLKNMVK
ncbi:uncharacterized protein EV422DRAFT_612663 [Fimicolochytrium jonesii]|uniref:uncharacterized protein n=1 Tax=Fimicolochytrium jonesii TaxID=1396493 RepID=UPI0022FE191A|nr:uncharacterized protein EV422DRAFT_612663 [Fimicolochytrium jonesii]KAI8822865.1 hypothetical protein EV422DRAFT_612663 [Fimicolochytrium jonesii]